MHKSKQIISKHKTGRFSVHLKAMVCRETKSLQIRMIQIEIQKSKIDSVFPIHPYLCGTKEKGRMIKEQTRITVCIQETKITVKTIL